MADKLDLLIFGATGFTGKYCIPPIYKLSKANGRNLSWGVSGRSEEKVKKVLEEMGKIVEADLSKIPIVVADIKNYDSLKEMASKAKVVINCCGPYRFLGEDVVKACIEVGTNHIDVSGEPQYMEEMQLKYHQAAAEKGVYAISACGLDSIPTDMGIVFVQDKFAGTLNSIDTYLKAWEEGEKLPGPLANYGTWESAVYGLAHSSELRQIRSKLYPKRTPKFEPVVSTKALPHQSNVEPGWAVPFLGSDRAVARRSQRFFYDEDKKRPVQVNTYLVIDSIIHVIMMAFYGAIFLILSKFEMGRSLLLKYPSLFSGGMFGTENPSKEKVEQTCFSVTLRGQGWSEKLANADDKYTTPPNKEIVAKVKGKNPGYGATCVCLVLTAIMVLTQKDKMPGKGGIYSPGAAFAKTSLIKELNENGVTFEVLSEKDI